jgi:uncharacterized membrane protein
MSSRFLDQGLLAYTLVLLGTTAVVACVVRLGGGSAASATLLLLWMGWVLFHSAAVRGVRQTAQFVLIAGGIAFVLEGAALRFSNAFHHTLQPQVLGVPPQVICAWIVYLYAGFAVTLVLANRGQTWPGALAFCAAAALVTTALDLTVDPVSVRMGRFAYHQGGAFMPEIAGVNGVHGIPLANYVGWMLLASGTYLAFWLCTRRSDDQPAPGRLAALLFYLTLFAAAAIPAVRFGYAQLLLIGGLPVALVALLVAQRLTVDRRARELSMRRGRERSRVSSLVERRLAAHRR